MSKKVIVIGLGHKARQGKDVAAGFIKKMWPQTVILHFADALYKEVENKHGIETKKPLVIMDDDNAFLLSDSLDGDGMYSLISSVRERDSELFGLLLDHLMSRGSNVYGGMEEKDAPMLQIWGTNFRRARDENYWVERVDERIQYLIQLHKDSEDDLIILIPDMRFENELEYVRSFDNGCYLRMMRLNDDGSQFIDPTRPSDHPSEISLDDFVPDFEIQATTGDMLKIHTDVRQLMEKLLNG